MIVPTANYPTSRNYAKLWELAHAAAIVCIVDMDHGRPDTCRDIARTIYSPDQLHEMVQVGSRGVGHVCAESLEAFIAQCEHCNLEWLVPPAPIPAPQSGLPWRTDGPAVLESREPASVVAEATGPRPLSPAAQAVLDAFWKQPGDRSAIAAAIRAVVDQVVPEPPDCGPASHDYNKGAEDRQRLVRFRQLAIAAELKGFNA